MSKETRYGPYWVRNKLKSDLMRPILSPIWVIAVVKYAGVN